VFQAPFETPYVVRLHNSRLLGEAMPLFSFKHPNTDGKLIPNCYYNNEWAMWIAELGSISLLHITVKSCGLIYSAISPISCYNTLAFQQLNSLLIYVYWLDIITPHKCDV